MAYQDQAAQTGRLPVEIVEVVMERCTLRHGVNPCPATGLPCYNTYATCQAIAAFSPEPVTYRFARPNANLPAGMDAISLLSNVTYAPQQITPGKGLGVRASVSIRFQDTDWPDHLFDPYFDQRTVTAGTFWGRWRARHRFYIGRLVHVYSGYTDAPFPSDWERRTYVLDAITGPDRVGVVTLTCKDLLKLADDNRAQCPLPSRAMLSAGIDPDDTTATLTPDGVGAEFGTTGYCRISDEICGYTRSGDTLTLTRAQFGSVAKAASPDDAVQDCKHYDNEKIQDVIFDLLTHYAAIPAEYIDKAAWDAECNQYLAGVWSTLITEPTGVNKLVGELTEQGLLSIWWDEVEQKIRLRALRAPTSATSLTDDQHFLSNTLAASEAVADRVSRYVIYFEPRSYTKSMTDASNFRQRWLEADPQSEGPLEHGSPKIKTIYSRWFNVGSLARVQDFAAHMIRYLRMPPRLLEFKLDESVGLKTGDFATVQTRLIQAASGLPLPLTVQVTESAVDQVGVRRRYKATEYPGVTIAGEGPADPLNVRVILSSDQANVNLRTLFESEYGQVLPNQRITFDIRPGVHVYSNDVAAPALMTGDWPDDVTLTLNNSGKVIGRGGNGGKGGKAYLIQLSDTTKVKYVDGEAGSNGGLGLLATRPITISNQGLIAGGGGGGGGGTGFTYVMGSRNCGGGGGGGGAAMGRGGAAGDTSDGWSVLPTAGSNAEMSAGRGGTGNDISGNGGDGGEPGKPGQAGQPNKDGANHAGAGGQPGQSVAGNEFINWTSTGQIVGA